MIAITLLVEWLKGMFGSWAIDRDMEALRPKIRAELEKLTPKIVDLQARGKVFARITLDILTQSGATTEGAQGGCQLLASTDTMASRSSL